MPVGCGPIKGPEIRSPVYSAAHDHSAPSSEVQNVNSRADPKLSKDEAVEEERYLSELECQFCGESEIPSPEGATGVGRCERAPAESLWRIFFCLLATPEMDSE
ncbi:hypothetical protein B0H11DRAFT_1900251 [Mycena galericulata]|nr:hypothetical protein B0H11DRAFT_1900251 [Mycena galericulata]